MKDICSGAKPEERSRIKSAGLLGWLDNSYFLLFVTFSRLNYNIYSSRICKLGRKIKLQGKERAAPHPGRQKTQQHWLYTPHARGQGTQRPAQHGRPRAGGGPSFPCGHPRPWCPHTSLPRAQEIFPGGVGLPHRLGLEGKGLQFSLLHTPACARAGGSAGLGPGCRGPRCGRAGEEGTYHRSRR